MLNATSLLGLLVANVWVRHGFLFFLTSQYVGVFLNLARGRQLHAIFKG